MPKVDRSRDAVDVCAIVFVAMQLVLFPLIQFTPADPSAFWSYVSIILVVAMAFVAFGGAPSGYFIKAGLVFTLVADYFLVIDAERLLEGVLAFILVQAAYFAYLFVNEPRRSVRIANALLRTVGSLILSVLAIFVLGEDADALTVASVLYYANLIINAVFAFMLGKRARVFAIGLALFAMCDLCIGLEVLFSQYLASDALSFFYGARLNLPWVFYQPSQVLIAMYLYLMHRRAHVKRV